MKLSTINESVSIIANIGVIASIVFLGLEMRQNTSMIKSQTRDAMTEKQMQFFEALVENEEIAEIWVTATESSDELVSDLTNLRRWEFYWMTQLRMWENEWYQYQQGLFEAEEFESRLALYERISTQPIYADHWKTISYSFAPSFRQLIDGMIAEAN